MTLRHAAVAGLVSAPAGLGCNAVLGLEELTYREGSAGEAGRGNVGGAGQAGAPSTGGTAGRDSGSASGTGAAGAQGTSGGSSGAGASGCGTVELEAVADTYLDSGAVVSAYGSQHELRVSGPNPYRRTLVRFDLARDLPVGARLVAATLELTLRDSGSGLPAATNLHRVQRSWLELEAKRSALSFRVMSVFRSAGCPRACLMPGWQARLVRFGLCQGKAGLS